MSTATSRRAQIEQELQLMPGGVGRAVLLAQLELNDLVAKLVGTSDHEHDYRIMATRLKDGRIGFEYAATGRPSYSFLCSCGDHQEVNLDDAVEKGWVALLDLGEDRIDPRRYVDIPNHQFEQPVEVGTKLWQRVTDASGDVTVQASTVHSVGNYHTRILIDDPQPPLPPTPDSSPVIYEAPDGSRWIHSSPTGEGWTGWTPGEDGNWIQEQPPYPVEDMRIVKEDGDS